MTSSQKLIAPEVHALNDVATVIEHSSNVLSIDGTSEMGVAVMPTIVACGTNFLKDKKDVIRYDKDDGTSQDVIVYL